MNEETRKLFSDLGSKNVKDLAFRDSWVFVGAKGVQNKSPFEQVHLESVVPLLPSPGQSACPFCLQTLAAPLTILLGPLLFTPQPALNSALAHTPKAGLAPHRLHREGQ